MSDTMQINEARETAGLLDAQGRVISQSSKDVFTQAEEFIQTQPIKAALIALGVGYIIGRLRLIV